MSSKHEPLNQWSMTKKCSRTHPNTHIAIHESIWKLQKRTQKKKKNRENVTLIFVRGAVHNVQRFFLHSTTGLLNLFFFFFWVNSNMDLSTTIYTVHKCNEYKKSNTRLIELLLSLWNENYILPDARGVKLYASCMYKCQHFFRMLIFESSKFEIRQTDF